MDYLVSDMKGFLFGVKKGRFTFFKWELAFKLVLLLGLPA